jgi:hypothetical protein
MWCIDCKLEGDIMEHTMTCRRSRWRLRWRRSGRALAAPLAQGGCSPAEGRTGSPGSPKHQGWRTAIKHFAGLDVSLAEN